MPLRLAFAALAAALLAATPAGAATVRVDGDGVDAFADDSGRLQVRFDGETVGQFSPGDAEAADAGLNVAVYPPSGAPPVVYGFLGEPLTLVAPAHTFGDPPGVAAVEWSAGSFLNVKATVIAGGDGFAVGYSFRNDSREPLHIRPSLAGDLNLGGIDRGGAFLETFSGQGFTFRFVGGQAGLLRGGFQDVSGDHFDAFEAGPVDTVFAKVRNPSGAGFDSTIARGEFDNAAGIQASDFQPGAAALQPGDSADFTALMRFERLAPTAERIEELPPPQPFQEVNVETARGDVFVRLPGGASASRLGLSPSQVAGAPRGFVPLEQAAQLPVGTIVDADRGALKLAAAQSASTGGRLGQATFSSGTFQIVQKSARRPVTEMVLKGGSFRGCPRTRRANSSSGPGTEGSARRRSARSRVRRLWGNGRGRFRTRGRYSSATVRGTKWLVEDRCDGTLTRVPRRPRNSRVDVRDLSQRRTVQLRAGQSYLARPRGARRRR